MIENDSDIKIAPAPWSLTGRGFMHFFWGKRRIDPYSGVEVSGIGGIIIAQYDQSPVGPYNELLYIPGRQKLADRSGFFISKIYVDSMASVKSGRANWGIPKEFAEIAIENLQENQIGISASQESNILFKAVMNLKGFSFPINTSLIPIPLVQQLDNQHFYTKFKGSGSAKWSSIAIEKCEASFFEDISKHTALGGLAVNPFNLTFPVTTIFK
jgi:hypothetical protein